MDIQKVSCPSCGAPIQEKLGKFICGYCGQEVLIESQKLTEIGSTIEKAQNKTQEVIASSSENTQLELRRLQLAQELSMLQMQLSNLRSERRNISLVGKKTKAHRSQLAQIDQEEQAILARINTIQSTLSPNSNAAASQNHSLGLHKTMQSGNQKSQGIALFLCILFGFFGAHRFYTGQNKLGIIYLFTFGILGMGWLLDIILLLTNSYKDVWGRPLRPIGAKGFRLIAGFIVWSIVMGSWISSDPNASPVIILITLAISVLVVDIDLIIKWIMRRFAKGTSEITPEEKPA